MFVGEQHGAYGVSLVADVPGLRHVGPVAIGRMRLPTETIGNAVVAFVGVQAGSEIRVYLPSGAEAAGVETSSADHVLTWPAYSAGNANNNVRVVIVHPAYRIKEFSYTCQVGSQTLPVQQEPDKWYSNP